MWYPFFKKTIPLLLLEVYILNKLASGTFRVSLKVPLSEILITLVNPSPKIVRVESLEFSRVPLNVKYLLRVLYGRNLIRLEL